MKKVRSEHIQIGRDAGNGDEEKNGNRININEVLTPRNLLKEAIQRAKSKNHSFKGYTINSEVRV